jgi:hypothetical protein
LEEKVKDGVKQYVSTVRKGKFDHFENPRQGVLGSEIKIVAQVAFWVSVQKIRDPVRGEVDVDWLFITPTEPMVDIAGPPSPSGAAAPGAAPAPAAKAAGEPAKAEGPPAIPAIRRITRPTPAQKAQFLLQGEAIKNFGPRTANSALPAATPLRSDFLGRPDNSITRRGSTNDYFVVHFGVQLIATPAGVDKFVKALEDRRFYTLARPPELASVDRGRYPAHDLGSDGLLEATLYFEGVVYQHAVRRLFDPAGDGTPPEPMLVSLMPPEVWGVFAEIKQAGPGLPKAP